VAATLSVYSVQLNIGRAECIVCPHQSQS